ncbi:hypothetical protein BH11MYX1_BH11MYX1_23350 [soil metagenome]
MLDPLVKPDHFGPGHPGKGEWFANHAAGALALVLGTLAFIVVAVTQDQLWATPDWRISVPAFAITAVAALVAIARKERSSTCWLLGLGIAGAALVLGWFLMLAVIIGATAVLILILHAVM